ncbi:MAG TPA: glycosyltransferase [Iamia sp.]|nr:glycosyltransferase [Iamia sp.]
MTRRVLHVVGDSGFGGGARVILTLAGAARDAGAEVDVLTTDPAFAAATTGLGLGVVDLDVIRRPVRPWWDLLGARRLARHLAGHPYDLVHTHTSKAGISGRWAAHRAGVPAIVHTVHGFSFHEATRPAVIRVVAAIERRAARWCDVTATVSEFHRDWAVALGIDRPPHLVAIPNGVDGGRVTATGDAAATRAALGLGPDAVALVSPGRVVADKGLEELLDAAATLRAAGRPVHVVIVGDGDLRPELEARAAAPDLAGAVTFTGFREDVADLVAAAAVVVLPSHREGMSIAVLEGMAAGRPLVVSSISSNREVVADGACAVLVPPGDRAGLVAAIETVLDDPAGAEAMAARARDRFRSEYTAEVMGGRYLDLYERLIGPASDGVTVALHPRHAAAVAELHVRAFPRFFLTSLGTRFLARFYAVVLASDDGVGVGRFVDGRLAAFAVGADRAEGFYRDLARRHGLRLGAAALVPLLRRPAAAVRLARSLGLQAPPDSAPDGPVLLSIARDPGPLGRGAGGAVLDAFEAAVAGRGGTSVALATDADDNDDVLAFYRGHGYADEGVAEAVGTRRLVRFRKPLAPAATGPLRSVL